MRRALFVVLAGLPAVAAALVACSSDPAPSVADAGTHRDASKTDAPFEASDAGEPRNPPQLPACLGDALPLQRSGEKSYVRIPMSAPVDGGVQSVGDFLVDFGSNASSIDLAGGFKHTTPPAPLFCNGDPKLPGASCAFGYFDFFGPWGTVYLSTADFGALVSTLRQSGILGTDFLSTHPYTLDHVARRILRGSSTSFCGDPQLVSAGFVPLPTDGFYVNDTKKLRPLSEVITTPDAGIEKFTVPNVPTVPIAIGGVNALAQLDTGFDDRLVRHSLNINEALLQAIQQKDPTLLERVPSEDIYLTTCVNGISQLAQAWSLKPGTAVDFLGANALVARHDYGTMVFVKDTPKEIAVCGGIDTWTVPAAQVGASFLVDAYAVVFDPFTSRVWIPK